MDALEVYVRLRNHLSAMPSLSKSTDQTIVWLGMAVALVEQVGHMPDAARLSMLANSHARGIYTSFDEINAILQRALARAELKAPASSSGAFIFAGQPVDVMAAVGKVLKEAKSDVLIVDPYLDETVLTTFAVMMEQTAGLRLLSDAATVKPALEPGIRAWKTQYPDSRAVEARLAPKKALHDRLIIVDRAKVWSITQSLKDFAARSPASLLEVDAEMASMKMQAYEDMWNAATPILLVGRARSAGQP
jgi:hypothetical protein